MIASKKQTGDKMEKKSKIDTEDTIKKTDNYLKGYQLNRKLLRLDRYEKEYFHTDENDFEAYGEAPLARARMFEIRHFIMSLKNSDEKLMLYYHYVKGESIERCAELLGIGRSSAFRMRRRALIMAGEQLKAKTQN